MSTASSSLPLSRVAVHTISTKPWTLDQCIEGYSKRGFGGISIWRELLESRDLDVVRSQLEDAGLAVASLVRGGFFVSSEERVRQQAIETTRRAIEEAAAIGAPTVVIVPGADADVCRQTARDQVVDALRALQDEARGHGVTLGVEPLHPMFAADRSCLCTLDEAIAVVDDVGGEGMGLVIDVYHLWWLQDVADSIAAAGRVGVPLTFHVSDWVTPTGDPLTARALMGDGCIPIRDLRRMTEEAGFDGFVEVELLSAAGWAMDQDEWLDRIAASCAHSV